MSNHEKTWRGIFISGLLTLIPIVATGFVLLFLFDLFDGWLAPLGARIVTALNLRLPLGLKHIPGLGILATLVLTFLTGLFASHYLGRQLLEFGERVIDNIPVIKHVYGGIRQIMDSFSMKEGQKTPFKTVVMFEFPRPGIWTLGFLTTRSMAIANRKARQELMNVFVPAAPIPSQGIFLMIPARDLHYLDLTAEEALKMIATLGLVQKKGEDASALPPPAVPKKRLKKSKA